MSTTVSTPRKIAAPVSANATLAKGRHTPVDATGSALTVTLPADAVAGVEIAVEKVDTSANAVTISGTFRGSASTLTLTTQFEARTFLSEGAGSWRPVSDHRTAASLAAAFAAQMDVTGKSTAAINAWLAGGGVKRMVGTVTITAPLVIPSGTTLDATSARVSLGFAGNLVNNAAFSTVKRILDATMTAASATLTSAADAQFTSADVGKPVTVQGAGTGGAPLTTTISAVTNATTATLAASAATSVTGQYAAVGVRDSNITVVGGNWDRAGFNFTDTGARSEVNAHSLCFRHVDGLTVKSPLFSDTGGKYRVNAGDCTRVLVADVEAPLSGSDVIHFNGPCSNVKVRAVRANSIHDDLVSFTARDSTARITDCAGDITDVDVDSATYAVSTFTSSVLKIVAGKTSDGSASYAVRRLTARALTGPDTNGAVVFMGDSSGGTFDDINLDGVRSLGGSSTGCIIIQGGNSIDRLTFRNLSPDPADAYAVAVNVPVQRMHIDGVRVTATTGSPNAVALAATGSIASLILDNISHNAPAGSVVRIGTSGCAVTKLLASNILLANGSNLVVSVSGGILTDVTINGLVATASPNPLGVVQSTTTLRIVNAAITGETNILWVQGTGAVTVTAQGVYSDNGVWLGAVTHKAAFFGARPAAKPALTYSRATETAANTGLRTALVALGLVTDSTVA